MLYSSYKTAINDYFNRWTFSNRLAISGLNRYFVLQNFRIAKNSGIIFSAYWKYFFVRHSSEYETSDNSQTHSGHLGSVRCLAIIRRFIFWQISDEKILSTCWKYDSAILCKSKISDLLHISTLLNSTDISHS